MVSELRGPRKSLSSILSSYSCFGLLWLDTIRHPIVCLLVLFRFIPLEIGNESGFWCFLSPLLLRTGD